MPNVLETLKKLPERCFALDMMGGVIMIKRGESGKYPLDKAYFSTQAHVDTLNADLGVTVPQREAMLAGSMFGWEIPAADPDNYNEEGKFKREALMGTRR